MEMVAFSRGGSGLAASGCFLAEGAAMAPQARHNKRNGIFMGVYSVFRGADVYGMVNTRNQANSSLSGEGRFPPRRRGQGEGIKGRWSDGSLVRICGPGHVFHANEAVDRIQIGAGGGFDDVRGRTLAHNGLG